MNNTISKPLRVNPPISSKVAFLHETVLGEQSCGSIDATSASTRRFIRDVVFSNVPVPFQKLQTYLWILLLTRALGANEFGAWSLFMITLSTALTVSTMNCGSSLMRFGSGERTQREVNQAFSTVLVMVASTAVVLALSFILFSKQLAIAIFGGAQAWALVILVAAGLLSDSLFEQMKNILRARRLNDSWAYLCLIRLAPETLIVIVLGMLFAGANAAAMGYVCISISSIAAGYVFLRTKHRILLAKPDMRLLSKYARYGLPLLPGVFASTLSLGADKYMVSHFLGLKQVGIYGACFAISAVVFFLAGPINNVLFPELAALYDTQRWNAFQQRFRSVQQFVMAFAFGTASILLAFPRQILGLIAPSEFASGSTTLAVLGIQGIFMAFVLLYVVILNTRLRVWLSTLFWLVSGLGIVLLDVIMVPKLGILGAAISQLIVTALGALVLIGCHWKLFSETFDPRWLSECVFSMTCIWILSLILRDPAKGFWGSLLEIVTGMLSFTGCLFITGYFTFKDVRNFTAVFSSSSPQ